MADQEETDDSGKSDSSLSKVQSQAKTNRLLLIVVGGLCTVLLCVMVTGLGVMFTRIAALTEAAEAEAEESMDDQFIILEQQLLLLSDFRKKELKKIVAYTDQLNLIRTDCSIEKAAPYKEFLVAREADFQQLVEAMGAGTASLAGMRKGSRKWLGPYKKNLEILKKRSISRKDQLMKLAESEQSVSDDG